MSENDDILDAYTNDSRGARRGAVISSEGKTRITIYLDNDVLDHFRKVATAKGRGYQTEINNALKHVIDAERVGHKAKEAKKGNSAHPSPMYCIVVNETTFDVRGSAVKRRTDAEIFALVQGNHYRARGVA